MNRIEKTIYNLVKKNPELKNKIRDIYQQILSLVPKKIKESDYKIIEREGYFYGFHDKIPWSINNNKLLAHKFNIENRDLDKDDKVKIGYFHGENFDKFKTLAVTKSWNWQQGSMLQWLDKEDNIIFNYWNGENNIAKVIDINGNKVKDLKAPIGAIDGNGEYGLTYSFERLNIGMPGYGYKNENDEYKNEMCPENSFLSLIDIKDNKINNLFSLEEIRNIQSDETMNNAYHMFTHCLISPDSKRFLFLHRWKQDGKRLFSRLISSDFNGEDIYIFPTDGMVSHFTWVGNDKVFAYANTKKYEDGYYLFEDKSNKFDVIDRDLYNYDGHPQYSIENDLIITDSYPNRFRIQELTTYDYKKNKKDIIAKLKSPIGFKDKVRCDLHPRWDRNGQMICFDSAHTGMRSLCTIDLGDIESI